MDLRQQRGLELAATLDQEKQIATSLRFLAMTTRESDLVQRWSLAVAMPLFLEYQFGRGKPDTFPKTILTLDSNDYA